MQIQWFLILAVAFTVVGLIQYAKGFFSGLPSWFWGLMLPAGCVAVAAAFLYLPTFIMVALLAMGSRSSATRISFSW
jgi:predicted CDP-diglyceride synthetase/phosphatidate cytidylyltransferase